MGLVGYSNSEGSDVEEKPTPKAPPKTVPNSSKPAFQKVVDRSNPHKIRVNLPEAGKEPAEAQEDEDGRPTKRARTDGGAFSGFNSFLPAPKRSANGASNGLGSRGGRLGSGVNLKTGAAPAFSREPVAPDHDEEDSADTVGGSGSIVENHGPESSTSTKEKDQSDPPDPRRMVEAPQEEPKKKGTAMMFKPLSVARKPPKKKPLIANGEATPRSTETLPTPQPRAAPKVSLFSAAPPSQENDTKESEKSGAYQPLIYRTNPPETSPTDFPPAENPYIDNPDHHTAEKETLPQPLNPPSSQSLSTIASDLNLSASAKRQLFGRQHPNPSAINVVKNFNTDAEYASNELLRQAGEQTVQHNPVRAIAPGKHSLKQLVSAASNQKDALEKQFASGRRNKKEAGSKYGW
ncbi:MAG: hypothetical protein Q9184_004175 [Pyrenodesmia sp. 2 TL-2023]